VRHRLAVLVLAVALGALAGPTLASAKKPPKHKKPTSTGPTAAQIHAAVTAAERSPDLWATVNVCTSSPGEDDIGIRGQMPSLGFATTLVMEMSVSYWDYGSNMFMPAGASDTLTLGKGTHGIHQGGVTFPFTPPATGSQFLVRGTVTFEWLLGSKVIGKVTKNTGHGYANVGYSDPPGYSSGTCTLT
jgi:hypothetical protein